MQSSVRLPLLSCTTAGVAVLVTACGGSPAPAVTAAAPVVRASSAPGRPAPVERTPADSGCPDFELPRHGAAQNPLLVHGVDACLWRASRGAPDARAVLERACAARSARGCLNLGMFLLAHPPDAPDTTCMASGVPATNGCRAMTPIAAFQRGCELGEPVACEREASHLFAGMGFSRDLERAGQLFEQACKAGVLSSCRYTAPDAPSSKRPECKKDADCVLAEAVSCPGRCDCPRHPHASAVDLISLKLLRARCERQRRVLENERLRGLPQPSCSPCSIPTDPPPAQPSHAICSAGVCIAI